MRTPAIIPERLAQVQAILAMFAPDATVEWESGFWWTFVVQYQDKPVRFKWVAQSAGSDFPRAREKVPHGGTFCRVATVLMAWARGAPVVPRRCWDYWFSIGLGRNGQGKDTSPQMAEYLIAINWPESVPCIGCGRIIPPTDRFDEYTRGRITGPGCLPMCEKLDLRKK
jgi:hypothetical protein